MLETIYLGAYTRRDSQGIYTIILDHNEKKLKELTLLIKENNPTYLDFNGENFIYSVTQEKDKGGIAAYQKQEDGHFKLINRSLEVGVPPCYVAVDHERQLVYGANYHQGIILVYQIETDGSVTLVDKIQDEGHGPHENQEGPHAHYTDLTPDNRLVVCDLGNDTVYTYTVSKEGKLTETARFHTHPGAGPRHLVFHPNGKIAYLFVELSSEVIVLDYDSTDGTFTEQQIISSIPTEHTDFNSGAAIRVSNDGKFVYATNRGHNSIVVYQTSNAGSKLELIQRESVEGDFPRDFNLSPNEKFVIVANQNSDNLTLFERNTTDGKLTLLQKEVYAPEVVCVKF